MVGGLLACMILLPAVTEICRPQVAAFTNKSFSSGN
jgi:hypothetical protein